ncbi:MAG: hypothetical protein Q8S84_04675 [bacterium]|nr:hypothetical protein [bacterium]MDP3380795.1 hypothetical protein [bacterium]
MFFCLVTSLLKLFKNIVSFANLYSTKYFAYISNFGFNSISHPDFNEVTNSQLLF